MRLSSLLLGASLFPAALGIASVAGDRAGVAPPSTRTAIPAEIVIPGEKVYPESLTSTVDGTVIFGSIGARTIYRAKPGSNRATVWVKPDSEDTLGIYGVLADDKSKTLWACYASIPHQRWRFHASSVLQAFDLQSGAVKARFVLPSSGAFCNDIAVGADGTVYATDSNNMEIVRLKIGASKLEVWAGNGFFGAKGGILDGISVLGKRVFVNTLGSDKLFGVEIAPDGSSGTPMEMRLDRAIKGPDGMRPCGRDGLLVAEGRGGRLLRATVSGNTLTVTTLKQGFADGPVAVTVVGTTAYVLEGQLAALYGAPVPNARPKPFHATAVPIDYAPPGAASK